MVRTMTIDDYEEVSLLWHKIKGFSIRSIDDSREGVARFLKRNPDSSRGCMYHVCVDPEYRMRGIGKSMVVFAMNALKKEHISKVSLIAFTKNDVGNKFWRCIGWTKREDLNYYDFVLNSENIERFND